jgi:hypothetical protein
LTIFRSPIGSSVYFILVFIDFPSFSPITCAIDANNIATVRKSDSHNAFTDISYAVMPVFFGTMENIFRDNTVGIKKACCAIRNEIPCFAWFSLSFSSSHSKVVFLISTLYQTYTLVAILMYGTKYGYRQLLCSSNITRRSARGPFITDSLQ